MKIIISIIILALVILCLYFVLKSAENFYVDELSDTEQEIFDTIEEMASLLYENPKVLSYAKYIGFNVNNEEKDERNDYDLNSIKDLAQRITDSYRSNYFVFTGDYSIDPDNSDSPEGVTHLNPKYYLHSNSEFNFNRQWLAPGWWEKHKPGFGNESNTNHHPEESYHRGSSEGIGAERIYEEHPDKYECNEDEWSKQGWYIVPNEDVDAFNNKNCMYIHILSPYRTAYDAIIARTNQESEVGVSTSNEGKYEAGGGKADVQGQDMDIGNGKPLSAFASNDKWRNAFKPGTNPPKFKALEKLPRKSLAYIVDLDLAILFNKINSLIQNLTSGDGNYHDNPISYKVLKKFFNYNYANVKILDIDFKNIFEHRTPSNIVQTSEANSNFFKVRHFIHKQGAVFNFDYWTFLHALEDYDYERQDTDGEGNPVTRKNSNWLNDETPGKDVYERDNDNNLNPGRFRHSLDGLGIILAAYILKRIKTEDYPREENSNGSNNSGTGSVNTVFVEIPGKGSCNSNKLNNMINNLEEQGTIINRIHSSLFPTTAST